MGKVLITGGASAIGEKLVKYFQQNGWEVFAHVNSSSVKMPGVHEVKADFSKLEQLDLPKMDVIINNAAIFGLESRGDSWKVLRVNALAPLQLALANKNATVINILDSWALSEMPDKFMSYAISKRLLAQYTRIFGMYGISIGATILKPEQSKEVFEKIQQKYASTMDDIIASLEYILSGKAKKGEIIEAAKCRK